MRKFALTILILSALAGCRTPEIERRERVEKAITYFELIKDRPAPEDRVFTLRDCIDTAIKNNLDIRVYELTKKISKERRTSAYLSMLPDIRATYDLTHRTNEPGATSISLLSGNESLEPSRSATETTGVFKVELVFSAVDFGLSYFKALQADDKARLINFQENRARQNLAFDVASSYFRVAAAQYAMENTEKLLKLSKVVEKNLDYLAKSKSLSPLRTLSEKKQILKLKQSLEEYKRIYSNSCIELKTLMGYAPWGEIRVETSVLDKLDHMETPPVYLLEKVALRRRPELYHLDTQTHISVLEARKAVLMMFPNVRMFLDFTNSSNPLLYNQSWWEIAIRCAYHLMRLPQQIKEWKALDMEIDEMEAKTIALTSGVMAQVRIAHANLFEVEKRFELSEAIYQTHVKQLKAAKEDAKVGGRTSQIELFKLAMETANASINRTQQLGNYYLAYHRLLNAVGVDSIDNLEVILAEDQEYEDDFLEERKELAEAEKELVPEVDRENVDVVPKPDDDDQGEEPATEENLPERDED